MIFRHGKQTFRSVRDRPAVGVDHLAANPSGRAENEVGLDRFAFVINLPDVFRVELRGPRIGSEPLRGLPGERLTVDPARDLEFALGGLGNRGAFAGPNGEQDLLKRVTPVGLRLGRVENAALGARSETAVVVARLNPRALDRFPRPGRPLVP